MRGYRVKKSGFTLLEVLIAAGILFIVGSATIGLTNSIIQGTNQTSSATVANRLASEGLELVTKIRDDTVKAGTGDDPWFKPAENSGTNPYGWYILKPDNSLVLNTSIPNPILHPDLKNIVSTFAIDTLGTKQTVGGQDYFRLICVEAVGATISGTTDQTHCNTKADGSIKTDGSRTQPDLFTCKTDDDYCNMTAASLARNRTTGQVIPPGNAVKVRSVVVWQDKDQYRAADLTTMLTDWKSKIDAAQN